MSTGMGKFTVRVDDGEPAEVIASKFDFIMVERETRQPVAKAMEQGYLEPVLRLAYQAAKTCKALPAGMTFDEFLQRADVDFHVEDADDEDDEAGDSGND